MEMLVNLSQKIKSKSILLFVYVYVLTVYTYIYTYSILYLHNTWWRTLFILHVLYLSYASILYTIGYKKYCRRGSHNIPKQIDLQ